MKNLELKFKCRDFKQAYKALNELGAAYNGVLNQLDVYFNIKPGRLKLRSINNKEHQLIYYKRANIKGSKVSNYFIEKIKDPKHVIRILNDLYGFKTVISKKRILYIFKNTRIHIDSVKGLGKFIELEIVCKKRIEELNAQKQMAMLKDLFKMNTGNIIKYSYSDLMISRKGE